jgi:hypothetical protein
MKNKIKTYMAGAALLMAFASCEKVIDVDIDEADKKYVIEANVSNSAAEPAEVKISQTKRFTDDNSFTGISGATVTIQVNNGTIYPLAETTTGVYRTAAFTGVPGSSYKLSVTLNGTAYTAVSVMPVKVVKLDTLTVEDFAFGGSTTKTIYPSYKDIAGLGDSYRFIQYVNGIQVKRIFVQNDDLSDGLTITRPFIDQDGDIESGDVVKVNMQCIDQYVYKYWYSLDQAATGANQSATPANPVSNISGGVLGYFSAHSVSSKTIVVP